MIKNNQFLVEVELPESVDDTISFNNLIIEANLLYDCTPNPKEVLQVKQKPYKYKGIVERGEPRKCTLQVSISILSSQHEDMNFLLDIKAKDNSNKVIAAGISEPVQVISKPDVLRKKREPRKKKRTWNDRITETLERIEAKQNEALKLISQGNNNTNTSIFENEDPFVGLLNTPKHPSEVFENAFFSLIRAYNEMTEDERPTKIRKLVHGSQFDPSVNEMVNEFQKATVPPPKQLESDRPTSVNPQNIKTEPVLYQPLDFDIDGLVNNLFSPM